jgi:hypothetical protein
MNSSTQGDPICAILLYRQLHHMCAVPTVSVYTTEDFHSTQKKENNVLLFMENSYYVHWKL